MESTLQKHAEKELSELDQKPIECFEVSPEKYNQLVDDAIEFLSVKKKLSGIYVSINKPVPTLMKYFDEKKIDYSKIFFIDAISGSSSGKKEEKKGYIVISNPSALTELSVEISAAIETKKYDYLFFDTVSTLLIYNHPKRCLQFCHYVMKTLRANNVKGIMLFVESQMEKEVFVELSPVSDKAVKV